MIHQVSGDEGARQIDWVRIRAEYEAGLLTINALAHTYGMTRAQPLRRAATNKWARPQSDITDRRILIFKLLALLEHQIDTLDELMRSGGKSEAGALGGLVQGRRSSSPLQNVRPARRPVELKPRTWVSLQRKLEKRINAITKA